MEAVFNKLEGEKIPEVLKRIKPSKFQKININNNNEKRNENENKQNLNISLITIKEIKEKCKNFLNKYKYLEYVESFDFHCLNIEGNKIIEYKINKNLI
jgi:hypothetical protein